MATVPIQDPNRGFRTWHVSEIYTGPDGDGQYVPNVDDMVIDWDTSIMRVIAVDSDTLLSTMENWQIPTASGTDFDENVVLTDKPGSVSEAFRAYVDDSVLPHELTLDAWLYIYGTANQHIKIFRGTDISNSGKVISAVFNQNGAFVSENIPLETVAMEDHTNTAVKTPKRGHTTASLSDGEVLTVVVYDDTPSPVSTMRVTVKKTAFIRRTSASQKYITGIHLESPYLSSSDPKLLEVPMNMNISGIPLTGVVNYSDGSKGRYPVDGGKFALFGMDNYIATTPGPRLPLVLRYKMSAEESSYDMEGGSSGVLTEPYQAKTTEQRGAYTVKLFPFPTWSSSNARWEMDYYLYNLDRDEVFYATPWVEIGQNSASFNGTSYGNRQGLTVAIDIENLSAQFSEYRHVQTFEVELLADGTTKNNTNWRIYFSPGQSPAYGEDTFVEMEFINSNQWEMNLTSLASSKQNWLEKVYRRAQPLYDIERETQAPEPTHALLVFNDTQVEIEVGQWDSVLNVANDLNQGETLFLKFIKRTTSGDLHVGMGAMMVHEVEQ